MQLQFIPIDICYEESLLNIWADINVVQYTNMKLPCTLDDVKNRIEIFKPFDVFVVLQNGELVGIIGCPPIDKDKRHYGLFYQFSKSSWGRGNATEATRWLIDFMQGKYENVTLFADVIVDNVASEKILQKFGFELLSEETVERNGTKLKVHNYKL